MSGQGRPPFNSVLLFQRPSLALRKVIQFGDPNGAEADVQGDWFWGSTGTQTLTPSLYTNNQTFYAPTVTPGAVTVSPSLYTNQQTFYAPSTTQTTAQIVYPSLFTNTNIFFAAEAINEYPDPSQVEFGVKYGPGGTLVGTLTGGGGSSIIRLRSFTERH